jgi:hypothetical protein
VKPRSSAPRLHCRARSLALSGWSPLLLLAFLLPSPAVHAHSASDAYITLTVRNGGADGGIVVQGQWDIALRDLDFVLKLDDDGDGRLTWGEVRRHQAAIERYAYPHLHLHLSGGAADTCAIKPTRQMVDDHADGAYAALFFDVVCTRTPTKLTLCYDIFFSIDPSHRGILVMHHGPRVATSVLSPTNAKVDLPL